MHISSNFLSHLPELPGIYLFKDSQKKIFYIGKAKNLKKRVLTYFQNTKNKDGKLVNLVKQIKFIETTVVNYEFEALLLEARMINIYQPKYNVIWKDDKHYIYIKITKEEFPRVLVCRKKDEKEDVFGPFTSSSALRDIIAQVRNVFPFCIQKSNSKKACFYTHIGLCNPCPSEISKFKGVKYQYLRKIYLKNIKQIKNLFRGEISGVKKYLKSEMEKYSRQNLFEQAAKYRNKLYNLEYLMKCYYPSESYITDPKLSKKIWAAEKEELINLLRPYFSKLSQLRKIECFDVSNTYGSLATGSMITFIDNQPDKKYYRRFRIKLQDKINDFAQLRELLKRRLNHPEWGMPDLLVVDGGTPQCRIFRQVLLELSMNVPFLGIAKEKEALVFPKSEGFDRIVLPRNSPALHLIQRVRDEAHRFAHKYHSLLRLKYMLNIPN